MVVQAHGIDNPWYWPMVLAHGILHGKMGCERKVYGWMYFHLLIKSSVFLVAFIIYLV